MGMYDDWNAAIKDGSSDGVFGTWIAAYSAMLAAAPAPATNEENLATMARIGALRCEGGPHSPTGFLLRQLADEFDRLTAAPAPDPVAWLHWLHGPVRVFLNRDDAMLELDRLNREYPREKEDRKMLPLYAHPAPVAAPREGPDVPAPEGPTDDRRSGGPPEMADKIMALADAWDDASRDFEMVCGIPGDHSDLLAKRNEAFAALRAAVERVIAERDDAIRHAHENNDWAALRNRAEKAEQDVKSATLSISVLQGTLKNAERDLAAAKEVIEQYPLIERELDSYKRERDEAIARLKRVEENLRDFQEHDKHYLERK